MLSDSGFIRCLSGSFHGTQARNHGFDVRSGLLLVFHQFGAFAAELFQLGAQILIFITQTLAQLEQLVHLIFETVYF